MGLRFFADHCVSSYVVEALREAGHEVLRVRDHMATNSADLAVIAKAQELASILVSLNGDFADIVTYPPQHYKGIVALQVRNHPEIIPRLVSRLGDYLSAHPDPEHYAGKLFLVEVHRIRARQGAGGQDEAQRPH